MKSDKDPFIKIGTGTRQKSLDVTMQCCGSGFVLDPYSGALRCRILTC